MSACCTAGPLFVSGLARVMDSRIVHCGKYQLMPVSCHFRDCKALLVASLTAVSATANSEPLPLPMPSLSLPEFLFAGLGWELDLHLYVNRQ